MADDLMEVAKKLLDNSPRQRQDDYQLITIANHIDYEKWNNHQRDANNPVFSVMGQFLGLPNLFTRTHKFFENSLIYYGPRPDLIEAKGDKLENRGHFPVSWNGQLGGLEGLRQKGWSVVYLLALLREAKTRNTLVRTLAQGDNQVVCNSYKIPDTTRQHELQQQIDEVMTNNKVITDAVAKGTERLGLLINCDETMTSFF